MKKEFQFTFLITLPTPVIIGLIFDSFSAFLVLFIIFGTISTKYIINSKDRMEPLNVLQNNHIIYFMLDDDFAKVELNNRDYKLFILNIVKVEMPTLKISWQNQLYKFSR